MTACVSFQDSLFLLILDLMPRAPKANTNLPQMNANKCKSKNVGSFLIAFICVHQRLKIVFDTL